MMLLTIILGSHVLLGIAESNRQVIKNKNTDLNDSLVTINLSLNFPVIITLPNLTSLLYQQVRLKYLAATYGFVTFQVHTQFKTVVSSNQKRSVYGEEYNSTNSGITKMLHGNEQSIDFYAGINSNDAVRSMLLAVPNIPQSPVPGACCQTCALEIDANIRISYNEFKTYIHFERGSRYWNYGAEQPLCDNNDNPQTYSLTYNVYYYYTYENDLSDTSLFDGLYKMSNPDNIKKYGLHLTTIHGASALTLTTETIFAQGVVFNVIVSDEISQTSAAYVPVATYACNFTSTDDECHSKGSVITLVYCVIFAVVGIVMCFAGFKLLRMFLFVSGMLFYWLICYVLLARYTSGMSKRDNLLISSLCSLIGGGLVLFMYAFKKSLYVCVLNVCVVFGMFIASVIFYTPLGYYSFWDADYRFVLGFVCCTLLTTAIFLFYPKTVCQLCSSLIGSYAVILLINYFLRANMQYIMLTVVYRMTVTDFGSSYLRRPYQKLDYILTGSWAFFFIIGFLTQYYTTKHDEFDISGKEVRERAWQKFSESIRINRKGRRKEKKARYYNPAHQNERTPLLAEDDSGRNQYYYVNQPSQQNFTTFRPQRIPSADAVLTDVPHSHGSREYQPLLHHGFPQPVYATAQPTAPAAEGRDPKIV